MHEWCADADFWSGTAPVVFSAQRWSVAPQEVDRISALVELPSQSRILDMPCGPGRHGLELARRGHHVTGVDLTAQYIDEARGRAEAESLDVEWLQADMRAFERPLSFDVVVNMFTSFGYFEDPADDRRVAQNFYSSLRPGGRLLMDLMGKEVLARIFQPREWHEGEDGTVVVEERTLAEDWGWIKARWIVIQNGRPRECRFEHRLYSAAELKALLVDVGFVDLAVYGGLDGTPYDHQAKRLVVVGRKPQ